MPRGGGICKYLVAISGKNGYDAVIVFKKTGGTNMKAIMTVIGPDHVGIIAGVTTLLASLNINILDLSQTIMSGIFTMTLLVDTAEANRPFDAIRGALKEYGDRENLSIRIQREDTFTAMHRI